MATETILGNQFPHYISAHLTANVITVKAGEDIFRTIMTLAQKEPHGICILSAVGTISIVTLLQPNSRRTQTYEGLLDIVSLTGSFVPTHNCPMKSRTGGLAISFATSDGTVFGGGTAGILIAASPVQLVVGSFQPHPAPEHHPKRRRTEDEIHAIPTHVSTPGFAGHDLNFGSPTTDLNLPVIKSDIQDPGNPEGDDDDNNGSDDESDDDDVVEVQPPNKSNIPQI